MTTNQTLVPEEGKIVYVIEVKVVNDFILFKDNDYKIYQLPLLNSNQGISADARDMIMSELPQQFEIGFQEWHTLNQQTIRNVYSAKKL